MKKKILVVDDEESLLEITLLRLRVSGYEAFGVGDGKAGLEWARKEMPDLIILDVSLPDIRGDEVAKMLGEDENLKHIPILLISAECETLAARARECGVEGYLCKPFESKELLCLIEKHVCAEA